MHTAQEVLDFLHNFAEKEKITHEVDGVIWREDHQDYQILLEKNFHIEIREKLIDHLLSDPKHADTKREIIFLLNHPNEFEEWEETVGKKVKEDTSDMFIDDDS